MSDEVVVLKIFNNEIEAGRRNRCFTKRNDRMRIQG
jgi:hypothetical protein